MIAPVLGSGAWPAWITRVAKPLRDLLSLESLLMVYR
jgi:hypothetical protein